MDEEKMQGEKKVEKKVVQISSKISIATGLGHKGGK